MSCAPGLGMQRRPEESLFAVAGFFIEPAEASGIQCPAFDITAVLHAARTGARNPEAVEDMILLALARVYVNGLVIRNADDLLHLGKIADAGHGHHMEAFFTNAAEGKLGTRFTLMKSQPNSGLNAKPFPDSDITVFEEMIGALKSIPLDDSVEGAQDFFRAFSVPNQFVVRGAYGEAKAIQQFLADNPTNARLEKVADWVEMERLKSATSEEHYYQLVQGIDSVFDLNGSKIFVESKVMANFNLDTLAKQFEKHIDTKITAGSASSPDGNLLPLSIGPSPKIVYALRGSAFTDAHVAQMKKRFMEICKSKSKEYVVDFCDELLEFSVDASRLEPLIP